MKRAGYPHLDEHLLAHKNLLDKTKDVSRQSLSDGNELIILDFLKEWWLNHINRTDREYASQVKTALRI
jgi:hemerythrin-like metal-binding protein